MVLFRVVRFLRSSFLHYSGLFALGLGLSTCPAAAWNGELTARIGFTSQAELELEMPSVAERTSLDKEALRDEAWLPPQSQLISSWAFNDFPDVDLHIWENEGRVMVTIVALGNEVSTFDLESSRPHFSIAIYSRVTTGENYYFCDSTIGHSTMVFQLNTFASVQKTEQLSPCTALVGGGGDGDPVAPTINGVIVRFSRYE
jgi:hypothetical protein